MENVFSQDICKYLGQFRLEVGLFQLIEKDMDEKFFYYEICCENDPYIISVYLTENQLSFWQEEIKLMLQDNNILLNLYFSVTSIVDKDWVTEVAKSYQPIETSHFFVKSSYYQSADLPQKIILQIDPQRAFGTGEHETTRSCLDLLAYMSSNQKIGNILDLGTGSGILAIASKKLWKKAKIIASDIDETSINIAKKNSEVNRAEDILFLVANGFNDEKILAAKFFDLIIVNILANYLIEIAEYIKDFLGETGTCILSGFLENQEKEIIAKYESLNFFVLKKVLLNNWVSLVISKKPVSN